MAEPGAVGVALKWVCLRPEVDALTGVVVTDERFSGLSDMDAAALELALRLGEARGVPVVAVTAGSSAAEGGLRRAAAVGASRVVRVDLPDDAPSDVVAAGLASVLSAAGCSLVLCGAHSLDRGSGSVPAFLAERTGAAQALGLVELGDEGERLRGLRRLDGGRREVLSIEAPAVCSVEGSAASLRRASLSATLEAGRGAVEVVEGPGGRPAGTGLGGPAAGPTRPLRPRARRLPPPRGEHALTRVLELTQAAVPRTPPRTIEADPEEAADAIVEQLRRWGELPGPEAPV